MEEWRQGYRKGNLSHPQSLTTHSNEASMVKSSETLGLILAFGRLLDLEGLPTWDQHHGRFPLVQGWAGDETQGMKY